MILIVSNAQVVSARRPPRRDIINFHGSTGVTSLAVNFFRLTFAEIVVASTEFGGKFIGPTVGAVTGGVGTTDGDEEVRIEIGVDEGGITDVVEDEDDEERS
jgi:hypothetical protein